MGEDLQSGADGGLMEGSEPKEDESMRCVIYLRVSTREQAEKGEGTEGFSIPAQREACTRHVRDAAWDLVDEYADRGESARSADRPALQAMLARIAEDRDVDAVVVHKIDRLARNMEDHVAIRALLRRRGVALVSVTENVEETASGRLVEGIHALMAEFYSANLASEIRKGMTQKAKMGGFPHGAPLGYLNLRELVGGRQVARIVADPERAPLVTMAFEHYATGEWTLQRLAGELAHRGLTNRGSRARPPAPITWQGLAKILANPAYVGIVEWNGVRHPGTHEPLATPETFRRVQELLAARAARGTRERKHPHYLKGLLHCGVCGRRLSIQHSKSRYTYFFCLGQKNDPQGTCRERYVAADDLEAQVEDLYTSIQLPESWAERLRDEIDAEIVERQRADAAQRELLTRRLAKAESERRKLLDAYYAGAIDVATLKTEQGRIGTDLTTTKDRLGDLDANLTEWQEILELAASLATRCGDAYRKASDRTRKQFNAAVFDRLEVKDGRLSRQEYRPPFDDIFSVVGFEYETRVEVAGIEPASSGFSTGLLRAQPTEGSRAPTRHRPRAGAPAGEDVPTGLPARPAGEPHEMSPVTGPWSWGRADVAVS
jgi:site-specific DNA recombinase